MGYFAILTLAATAGILYWQSKKEQKRAKPSPPPSAVALARLARLEKRTPKTPEELDQFYVELSDTIRTYLEKVTGINAQKKPPQSSSRR